MTRKDNAMRTISTTIRRGPLDAVRRRLRGAPTDRGAQAMEYALLGGVSVAGCTALSVLFGSEPFQDFLGNILGTIGSWFAGVVG